LRIDLDTFTDSLVSEFRSTGGLSEAEAWKMQGVVSGEDNDDCKRCANLPL